MNNLFLPIMLTIITFLFGILAFIIYRKSWELKEFRALRLGRFVLSAQILTFLTINLFIVVLASWFLEWNNTLLYLLFFELVLLLLTPFLISLVIVIMIIVLTIKMWRYESKSLANFLLPVAMLFFMIVSLVYLRIQGLSQGNWNWLQIIATAYPLLSLYLGWQFIIFYVSSRSYRRRVRDKKAKYYVVHGAGLIGGFRVGKLLGNRIKAAVDASDSETILVLSGGKGTDEHLSEALAMQKYAVEELGFPLERTMLEDKSTTTYENLINSAHLIQDKFIIFTSDYHAFRTALLAAKIGLNAQAGQTGKTALYYRAPAFLREFIAVMNSERKKYLLVGLIIVGFLVVLSLISLYHEYIG